MRSINHRALLVAVALSATLAPRASAQFAIIASSIAEGQTNVPLVDSVYFTFNQQLPFNSLFTSKFYWAPNGHYQRTEVFLDEDRQTPRFRLLHQQNYDFSVYVFGVQSASGQRMQRPFALNYTTSPTIGNRQVAGTVQFGTRTPPSVNLAGELVHLHNSDRRNTLERTLAGTAAEPDEAPTEERRTLSPADVDLSRLPEMPDGTVVRRLHDQAPLSSIQQQSAANLDYTVIVLLDEFAIDALEWSPRAAAAITASGTFNFLHVRPGTYYPVAFTFSDDTGQSVSHYGYYDPDGDFTPDPVTVNSGDLSGIQLNLYPYNATQSFENKLLAESEALSVAGDAVLRNIRSNVEPDGTALSWTYRFFSQALATEIHVVVDPLTVSTSLSTPEWLSATTPVPRTGLIDSGAAITVANANGGTDYLAVHGPLVTMSATGGNLLNELPAAPTELLWKIQYAALGSTDPPFVIYIDMTTGLEYVPLPVELSSFDAIVDGSSVLLTWTTESESNNAGFDIQMQELSGASTTSAWRSAGFEAGRGTTSERFNYRFVLGDVRPGQYQFRLKQIDIGGASTYSPLVSVTVTLSDALVLDEPWPNPAANSMQIDFGGQSGKPATVVLYDVLGRHVATLFDGEADGARLETLSLNVASLPNGTYFVRATQGGAVLVRSVIVAH